MRKLFKIWILVFAMVFCGALPPQVIGDNGITAEWSMQAKSKNKKKNGNKKSKKNKKSDKDKKKKNDQKSKKDTKKKDTKRQAKRQQNTVSSFLTAPVQQSSNSALLGVGIPKGMSNQVLNYKAMRINFNPSLRIPNCVSYELTATMVSMADAPGHEDRKNYDFAKDPGVKSCPEGWDYKRSGYSRGHMAPAMDMRWDPTAMAQSFYMTNMCPQDIKLNNDHWRNLEEKIHRWAKRDKSIYIYTGPIVGSNPEKIGKDKKNIAVPDAFFKVLYAPGQNRAIAFIYANKPCPGSYRKYAVTVNEVERRTGLTFPSAIPKNQCKPTDWE